MSSNETAFLPTLASFILSSSLFLRSSFVPTKIIVASDTCSENYVFELKKSEGSKLSNISVKKCPKIERHGVPTSSIKNTTLIFPAPKSAAHVSNYLDSPPKNKLKTRQFSDKIMVGFGRSLLDRPCRINGF